MKMLQINRVSDLIIISPRRMFDHAHLTGWLDSNTVTACAFKLLYWDIYIHDGFAIVIIVGIWFAAKVRNGILKL